MTKIIISGLVILMFVLAFSASAAPANFGGNGQAWTNDYGNHYVNNNNPNLRMDWDNQRFAVPGQGGHHANENAPIRGWGAGSLVDPHWTYFSCPR